MAESDEGALIERASNGDRSAFGALVEAHGRVVYNLALRMTGNAEDARDVAQTVFLKAWEKLHTFDRRSRFFSWVYRIAIHETLNHRGRRRRHEVLDEGLRSNEPGPAEQWERTREAEMVQAALGEMRTDDREVLVLRHFLRLSHRDMGELLHVPEKTVKSRLHTALTRLESALRRRGLGTP